MTKIKGVVERFNDLVWEDQIHRDPAKRRSHLARLYQSIEGGIVGGAPRIDWKKKHFRAAVAETSLRLSSHYRDDSLRQAFDEAQLDPNDPKSWATLLRIFAFSHFGPPKTKRGGKRVWGWRRFSHLLADFAAVKSSHPDHSDSSVCENIKTRFFEEYLNYSAGTIRRNLQYARDVKKNEYLKAVSDTFEKSIEEAAAKRGRKISRTEIESKAVEKAIQKISEQWKRPPQRQ